MDAPHAVVKAVAEASEAFHESRERPPYLPTARNSEATTPQLFDIYSEAEEQPRGSLIANLETRPEDLQELRDGFRNFGMQHQLLG